MPRPCMLRSPRPCSSARRPTCCVRRGGHALEGTARPLPPRRPAEAVRVMSGRKRSRNAAAPVPVVTPAASGMLGTLQALPYNAGVDVSTVTDTIARAKERLASGRPSGITPPSAATPVATTIITTVDPSGKPPEPVEDLEIAEDDVGGAEGEDPAAAAAARAAGELAEIEALTALPQAEDELLYAVPMCAPYESLSRCKFRVKLVPGSLRKGKACKQLLDVVVRSGTASARCVASPPACLC